MVFRELKLKGAFEIQLEPKEDERGYFARTYDEKVFAEHGLPVNWVQENESFSARKGTVRGLHFQHPPHIESKLVRATSGEIFFAIVDLRKDSPTFGKWDSVVLSADKKNMVFVPRGFANGICSLTDNCKLHYKMDNIYDPASADAIFWNDPDIKIDWPITEPAVISEKDKNAKSFKELIAKIGGRLST